MSDITDEIEKFRAVLKTWDDGQSSAAQCLSDLHGIVMDPLLDALENNPEGVMTFGSCCCSSHPPTRTFDVRFTIEPHGYTAKRVGEVLVSEQESDEPRLPASLEDGPKP